MLVGCEKKESGKVPAKYALVEISERVAGKTKTKKQSRQMHGDQTLPTLVLILRHVTLTPCREAVSLCPSVSPDPFCFLLRRQNVSSFLSGIPACLDPWQPKRKKLKQTQLVAKREL